MRCLFIILAVNSLIQITNCPLLQILQDFLGHRDVHISSGIVRGFPAIDGDYYSYLGIPYAAPPIGIHRFKAPFPADPWGNIFRAVETVACPQSRFGQENCLVVNVFTPRLVQNKTLPVLLYIHGGSFLTGNGPTSGAELLVKQHIIVVTVNYRLGALGFLCLGIHEAPGNAGLKDIVAALKWTRLNINNFGGDPDQITIYGTDSGAASVELLILSNMAKGLFKKAIVESGSALNVWAVDFNPIKTARNVAQLLKINNVSDVYKIHEVFQNASTTTLTEVNQWYQESLLDGTVGFSPCIERRLYGTEPFLTESPSRLLTKEKYIPIPMLISFSSDECSYLVRKRKTRLDKQWLSCNYHLYMPGNLQFDTAEIRKEIANNIWNFYFGNRSISFKTYKEFVDYFSDVNVLHGVLNSASLFSRNNTLYLMEFSYNNHNKCEGSRGPTAATHLDMSKHLFEYHKLKTESDKLISQTLVRFIANFIKFGNPVPSYTKYTPISWPAVERDKMQYLRFDTEMQVLEEPFWDRKLFWDQLYSKFGREINQVQP